MGKAAVAKAIEDINAALAVLTAEATGAGLEPFSAADPLAGLADGCLEILTGAAGVQARVSAVVVNAVGTYADRARVAAPPEAPVQGLEMAIAAEIGALLSLSGRAAGALLAQSHALTISLPRTLAALEAGTISWQHALVMVDETATLDPSGAAALEAHFLDPDVPRPATAAAVGEMPAYRFKAKARTWRERHHAESIEKRHAKGVAERRVEYQPDQDGMAWLSLYLPGDTACAIWNRVTALARGLQGPDEPRTLTQLRADIATGLLLTAPGAGTARDGDSAADLGKVPPPKADVLVTVPIFALLGLTDEPALLDGYGPIPPSMARDLVGNGAGSFYRVLVDPRDGAPLEIGRTSYRLTKAMKKALQLRDGKCTFPGCNNPSLDNEADHLHPWHHGGTTGISNLGQLCPKHHHLKHATSWKPTPASHNQPPAWTSPTGRHYKAEHHDWEPPHWPPSLLPTGGPPDFIYAGLSPGEEGLERFLHAPPA
ncbi:HNH endonuclease family protein [Arthrobacter sp. 9AX]|uniref:HNH endonuclease signature motif containing protein n=1 Tax=Arthrobacter sp. 9AX TaxID=2653131 RepID=UPI0012F3FD87|nr:HNH endonuclease signature motif containing protein [Arthrobacter sp. 9AX]VXB24292.1 HNH endonuclease family protein [Arthrobacter sp. 9AX]